MGSDDKIEYFQKTPVVEIHITNEYGSKMILITCGIRLDINIDDLTQVVSHFISSIKPIDN